ncbi:MAG: FAD-binding protein [Actinomycetia bacterium]|nr:FAD-binding protein [Actinomycetes bacterium]
MAVAPTTIEVLAEELARALAPDRVSRSAALREQHGGGETYIPSVPPDIVVFPTTIDEVVTVIGLARELGAPVIPHGAGTSVEGHVAAIHGGISVDMGRMNRILGFDLEALDVSVEAGVTRMQLADHLGEYGVFFPVDPGADATVGGMVATGASGTTTVRYGSMRENVLSLRVVTAQGHVITTASRARKSSAGYDLTRLFVGSEGTLGIVAEATLRVYGIPESIAAATCSFPSVDAAVQAAINTVQLGIPIARVELLDEVQMEGIRRLCELKQEPLPTLFLEFHGSEASVAEQAREVEGIARELGGSDFTWSVQQEERTKLWEARHLAWEAAKALRPGCAGMSTDVCVPISELAECLRDVREDIDASGLVAAIVGHVGDGNFHVVFLLDPDDPAEIRRAQHLHERMIRRAIAVGGTCTGEHGIGVGKTKFLELEHGAESVALMRALRDTFDPDGIMNPGKIFPEPTDG